MVRIGIAGLGEHIGIARQHIRGFLLQPNATISALYDPVAGQAEKYRKMFNLDQAMVCSTYDELVDNCDAVVVATPNAVHIPCVVDALKKGRHVLCEKPFSTDADSCADALVWQRLSGKVCMVGFCYRGIPAYRYMKKLVEDGYVGKVFYVRETICGGRITNPAVKREWRMQRLLSGPGALADFGVHMLDMTDWVLSSTCGRFTQVQCMEGLFVPQREREDRPGEMAVVDNDDVAVFNAKMENGTLVSFTASRIGGDHVFEIYGSEGYIGFFEDPFSLTICKNGKPKEVVKVPDELYMDSDRVPLKPFEINFYFQAEEFLAAIESGEKVATGFERGVYIQKLVDALHLSAMEGVSVPIEFTEEDLS